MFIMCIFVLIQKIIYLTCLAVLQKLKMMETVVNLYNEIEKKSRYYRHVSVGDNYLAAYFCLFYLVYIII